jgi:nucleotide-binding universal stress UspA family protein
VAERIALRSEATLRVISAVESPVPAGIGIGYGYADLLGLVDENVRGRLDDAVGRLDPATVLADEASAGLDLLVVGSRGYGPVRRIVLGSVVARLLRLAPCPVLVLPRGAVEPAAERPLALAATD